MSKLKVTLPKQWRHWCRKYGFRIQGIYKVAHWQRRGDTWFYLIGKSYMWRVNCFGNFQRGDTYEQFDRWALCEIKETTMPKTEKEFVEAIRFLLEK